MRKIEVCLSTELIHLYDLKGKIVVVVDILRATSTMVTGFAHHVEKLIPVTYVEECKALQAKGCIGAGERGGQVVESMDMGNSPYAFMDENLKGKTIAMTTTNGTLAIQKSLSADKILIGAFLNIQSLANYLKEKPNDVLIFCAGWKGKFNLEDSLFAGNLIELLKDTHYCVDDAALATKSMYSDSKGDITTYLANCAHVQRLSKLNIEKDIEFCFQKDKFQVIPVYDEGKLVAL